jgi:hypothetical protein
MAVFGPAPSLGRIAAYVETSSSPKMKSKTIHVAATEPLFIAAGSRLRVGAHAAMSDARM